MILELKTFLIAMLPITELRGSIPIALTFYHLPVWSAYLFSVLGNIAPVILIISFLEKFSVFLRKNINFFDSFFKWLFEKTRKRHAEKFKKWEELALVMLVAIPLPFTGAWTGCICSFVFGIPLKKAFPLITLGCLISGIIVTLLTLGITQLI